MDAHIYFSEATQQAFLTPYLCSTSLAAPAVIICPGGAYSRLAEHEGRGYAQWLSSHGVSCFVLHYRFGLYPAAVTDLANALSFLAKYAADYNIDPSRFGIMGSSAGAHLITTLYNATTRQRVAVDVPKIRAALLCYPVISLITDSHTESRYNLLGDGEDELACSLSAEVGVTADFPETFLWHTADDQSVSSRHSLMFAAKLSEHQIPFSLHVFDSGRHGLGLNTSHPWDHLCVEWLRKIEFILPSLLTQRGS